MTDVPWIKILTTLPDDEKIKIIDTMPDRDAIIVIWIKLIIQAGKTNATGYIYLSPGKPYTDEMLAAVFNRPLNTVRLALSTFCNLNMIEIDEDGVIFLPNFPKIQNIEGLERIRELTRQRVAKHRDKTKSATSALALPVTLRNATDKIRIEGDKNRIEGEEEKKEASSSEIIKMELKDYVEELKHQFEDIHWENEMKKFQLYWTEDGRKLQHPKSALFNWMLKARDFKKEKDPKAPLSKKARMELEQGRKRLGLCESCGEEGHTKFLCPRSKFQHMVVR